MNKQFTKGTFRPNGSASPVLLYQSGILNLFLLVFFTCNMFVAFGQSLTRQNGVVISQSSFAVIQLSSTTWNTPDGLPCLQAPGVNLGVVDYCFPNMEEVAYLNLASSEVLTVNSQTGSVISRFNVEGGSEHLTFDLKQQHYYVVSANLLSVYSKQGQMLRQLEFDNAILPIWNIARFQDATYLHLPDGSSVMVEAGGNLTEPKHFEGWVMSNGIAIVPNISGNSFFLSLMESGKKLSEARYVLPTKVAAVIPVGLNHEFAFVELHVWTDESQSSASHYLVSIPMSGGKLGKSFSKLEMPDVLFCYLPRPFELDPEGSLHHLISAPAAAYLFKVKPDSIEKDYPSDLRNLHYNYNNHLLNINE